MSFDFPVDIVIHMVTTMSLLYMLEFAKSSRQAYDIVRKEFRSRHHRMLKRFIPDSEAFLQLMRDTGCIISGSFALHYFEGDGSWTANDLDIYTPYETYAAVVEFWKKQGYYPPERKKDGVVVRYPRVFRRTKALLTGVKAVVSLVKDGRKVDIIQTLSPFPVYAVLHFWSTLQMNYLTADGFCCLYPQLTFSGLGLLAPVALNAVTIPRYPVVRLIKKYQVRGYRFVTRQEAVDHHTFEVEPIPVECQPNFDEPGHSSRPDMERGVEDGKSFIVTFGTRDSPYKIGASLHASPWRIGWRLGGLWNTRMWPSKVHTFNKVTGRNVDLFAYLEDISKQEEAEYMAEVAAAADILGTHAQ